jgi:hypothetical protein
LQSDPFSSSIKGELLNSSDFDFENAPASGDSIDPVLGDAKPSVCENHPFTRALRQCTVCQARLCEQCVKVRAVAGKRLEFCAKCGGSCSRIEIPELSVSSRAPVGERGVPPVAVSFAGAMAQAFTYPFNRDGTILLVSGTLFFWFMQLFTLGILGVVVSVLLTGYLCAYFFSVVTTSANGDPALPPWPDFSNAWEDILQPMFLFAITALLCFGPALLASRQFPVDHAARSVIVWTLGITGALYFPMALLAVVMSDSLAGLNPLLVIPSALKVINHYVLACAALGLAFLLDAGVSSVAERIPLVGGIIAGFFALYSSVVAFRILGMLYYLHRERLGWFNSVRDR